MRTGRMAFSPDGAKWVPSVPQPYWKWDFLPSETSHSVVGATWESNDLATKAVVAATWDGSSIITGSLPSDASGQVMGYPLSGYVARAGQQNPYKVRLAMRWRIRGAASPASSSGYIDWTALSTQTTLVSDLRSHPRDMWTTTFHPHTAVDPVWLYEVHMEFLASGSGLTANSRLYLDVDWIALYNDADF